MSEKVKISAVLLKQIRNVREREREKKKKKKKKKNRLQTSRQAEKPQQHTYAVRFRWQKEPQN